MEGEVTYDVGNQRMLQPDGWAVPVNVVDVSFEWRDRRYVLAICTEMTVDEFVGVTSAQRGEDVPRMVAPLLVSWEGFTDKRGEALPTPDEASLRRLLMPLLQHVVGAVREAVTHVPNATSSGS